MKKAQSGFTLIELVMVIVILGILAAVALPKFVDLKSDAQMASMQGVAGAAASASAINYAGCSISKTDTTKCTPVSTCDGIGAILSGAAWPTGYSGAVNTGNEGGLDGTAMACKLILTGYTPTSTVTYTGIKAGN